MKIKAALLRGSQKRVAGDAAEHFSSGLGGLSICILNELGGSATVSQRTSTFGKQERETRRGGDKGLSSDWTMQSSGSRQSAAACES